jgi:hypothetical protein
MSERSPELPPELDEPVLAMLAKDAAARPSSVGAAFRALEEAARRAGIAPPSGLPRLPRPSSPPEEDVESSAGHSTARPTGARRALAELEARSPGYSAEGVRLRSVLTWGAVALLVGVAVASLSFLKGGTDRSAENSLGSSAPSSEPFAVKLPAAPPAQPSVSAPKIIELTVSGAPENAEVMLGDRKLGSASGPVLVPYGTEPVVITVAAPDHEPKTLHLTPSASMAISVPLVKARRVHKREKTPSDLENPF